MGGLGAGEKNDVLIISRIKGKMEEKKYPKG